MTQHHLIPDELAAYHARRLPASELLSASDHLAACEQCRAKLLALRPLPFETPASDAPLTLSYEELAGLLDDELDPLTRRDLAATLARSPQARAQLADLAGFRAEMNALPPRDHAVDAVEPRPSQARLSRWVLPLAAAVALSGAALWWMSHPAADAAGVVKLRDGSRVLRFSGDGRSPALASLPAPVAEWVADAIRTGRINIDPDTARLTGQVGTLAGAEEDRTAFRLLSPVATSVADQKPRFRWTAAPGSSAYRINIVEETSGALMVSEEVPADRTEWVPAEPLPRGEVYQWEVQALRGEEVIANTPAPPQPEARFQVLAQAALAELEEAKRASSGSAFVMGVANARAGLIDDALQSFRALAADNPDSELLKQLIRQLESQRSAQW